MTKPQPVPEQRQVGPSVGDGLRLRREQLGWSLPEVADSLRIKPAYLQAIENNRPQDLPGGAYALGFLRSYAAFLGLDGPELSRQFREECGGLDRRPDLRFPALVPERGVPAGAAILLGVVLLALAYAGWYRFGGQETLPVHTVPPLPESLMPDAANAPHPAPVSPQSSISQSPTLQSPTLQAPTLQGTAVPLPGPAAPGPPVPAAPAAATSPASPVEGNPASAPAPAVAPPAPAASAHPVTSQPVTSRQITIKAVASSWVQIRQKGGSVLYEHILQPGETWSAPPDSTDLRLSVGNAGGIVLSTGDVTTPVLGRPGMVRRNLPLSAAAIRDGSLLATPPGHTTDHVFP